MIYNLKLFSTHQCSIMPTVLESRLIIFMRHNRVSVLAQIVAV
jgi:hypothetical protein